MHVNAVIDLTVNIITDTAFYFCMLFEQDRYTQQQTLIGACDLYHSRLGFLIIILMKAIMLDQVLKVIKSGTQIEISVTCLKVQQPSKRLVYQCVLKLYIDRLNKHSFFEKKTL